MSPGYRKSCRYCILVFLLLWNLAFVNSQGCGRSPMTDTTDGDVNINDEEEHVYFGAIRLNLTWTKEMADTNSQAYTDIYNIVYPKLLLLFACTWEPTKDTFKTIKNVLLSEGSVVTKWHLVLTAPLAASNLDISNVAARELAKDIELRDVIIEETVLTAEQQETMSTVMVTISAISGLLVTAGTVYAIVKDLASKLKLGKLKGLSNNLKGDPNQMGMPENALNQTVSALPALPSIQAPPPVAISQPMIAPPPVAISQPMTAPLPVEVSQVMQVTQPILAAIEAGGQIAMIQSTQPPIQIVPPTEILPGVFRPPPNQATDVASQGQVYYVDGSYNQFTSTYNNLPETYTPISMTYTQSPMTYEQTPTYYVMSPDNNYYMV